MLHEDIITSMHNHAKNIWGTELIWFYAMCSSQFSISQQLFHWVTDLIPCRGSIVLSSSNKSSNAHITLSGHISLHFASYDNASGWNFNITSYFQVRFIFLSSWIILQSVLLALQHNPFQNKRPIMSRQVFWCILCTFFNEKINNTVKKENFIFHTSFLTYVWRHHLHRSIEVRDILIASSFRLHSPD